MRTPLLFTFLFTLFSLNLLSQEEPVLLGSIFSIGASQNSFESTDIPIVIDSAYSFYLSYDMVVQETFTLGVKWNNSIPSTEGLGLYDFTFRIGYELLRPNRFQIPFFIGFNAYGYNDKINPKTSGYGWSGQAGIRFYVTNSVAIDGNYQFSSYGVHRLGEDRYDEAIGKSIANHISLGLSFYINK